VYCYLIAGAYHYACCAQCICYAYIMSWTILYLTQTIIILLIPRHIHVVLGYQEASGIMDYQEFAVFFQPSIAGLAFIRRDDIMAAISPLASMYKHII